MAGAPITHEEVEHARQVISDHGLTFEQGKSKTCGSPKLSKLLNITKMRADGILDKLRRPDQKSGSTEKIGEGHEITGDSWTVTLPKTRIHTLDQLLEYCEVDQSVWEVERFVANKWEMGYKDKAGEADVEQLFQVKAFLKRNRQASALEHVMAKWTEQAKKYAPLPRKVTRPTVESGNLLEVIIPDHHDGTLAWGKETGAEDWDLEISDETYRCAVDGILERASSYKFDQVLHVIGNDRLDVDSHDNTTTHGTPQDTDSRYPKICEVVFNREIETIELLRKVGPVRVEPIRGNHDWVSVWWLGFALAQYFRNYDDVEVVTSPKPRRAYQWGKVMIGLTHSDKEGRSQSKLKDLPGTFAAEYPQMYADTMFREIHVGHWHSVLFVEKFGMIVRGLSSLCPPDAWTAESGFIGSHRRADSFYWNKETGPLGTGVYALPRRAA